MTWKNGTFLIGFTWLIYGALFFDYPDWDIGVSVVMSVSTYFTAGWVWRLLVDPLDRPLDEIFAIPFMIWWCVDGSYWAYWSIVDPTVMIREGQWPMSLCLYLLCGAVWNIEPRTAMHQLLVFFRK